MSNSTSTTRNMSSIARVPRTFVNNMVDKSKTFYAKYKYRINTLGVLTLIVFIGLTLYFIIDKSFVDMQEYSTILYGILMVAALFSILIFLNQMSSSNEPSVQSNIKQQLKYFVKYLSVFGVTTGLFALILYGLTSSAAFSVLMMYVSLIGACIIGLYLLHSYISKKPFYKKVQDSGILSVLYHAIFLIPCLLIDGGFKLKSEINKTTTSVVHLLLAEIIFLMIYFLGPKLYNYIKTHNMKVLLDKPIYINNPQTIGTFENLRESEKDDYKYKYGLSLKIFIDQNLAGDSNTSVTDAVIFDYGGKPTITYNAKTDTLKISCATGRNDRTIIYEKTDVAKQKWNHFIVNYTSGTMDVFLNGTLVCSQKGLVPYMTYDDVNVGQQSGLRGGIKEVYYSKRPFTLTQIKMM